MNDHELLEYLKYEYKWTSEWKQKKEQRFFELLSGIHDFSDFGLARIFDVQRGDKNDPIGNYSKWFKEQSESQSFITSEQHEVFRFGDTLGKKIAEA